MDEDSVVYGYNDINVYTSCAEDDQTDIIVSHDKKKYVHVDWGEVEKSYLLLSSLQEKCYAKYIFDGTRYISDGHIYRSPEGKL